MYKAQLQIADFIGDNFNGVTRESRTDLKASTKQQCYDDSS